MGCIVEPSPRGLGLVVQTLDVQAMSNYAVAAGEVVMFDMAQTVATSTDETSPTSVFYRVIAPTVNASNGAYPCGIALAAMTSGEPGPVRVRGMVQAWVESTGGGTAITLGDPLYVAFATKTLDVDPAAGYVIRASAMGTYGASSTPALRWVLFDGSLGGFGCYLSAGGGY